MGVSPQLMKLIPQSGIVMVLGAPGSGKSCMCYSILEELHQKNPGRRNYVYGFPKEKAKLLPSWLSIAPSIEFPEESVVLADEAYRSFYSRDSMSSPNKFMDVFSGLVRQKEILAFYVTQTSRKLDIGLVSGAQVLLVKRPSLLAVRLDRGELRNLLTGIMGKFRPLVQNGEWKACVYVLTDTYEGMIETASTPASFWSEELSRPFKGVRMTQEKLEEAEGFSWSLSDLYRMINATAFDGRENDAFFLGLVACAETLRPYRYEKKLGSAVAVQIEEELRKSQNIAGEWASQIDSLVEILHLLTLPS